MIDGRISVDMRELTRLLVRKNLRILDLEERTARLEQDNAAAHARAAELEEHVAALEQTLADTEDRLAVAEATLTLWEDAADCVGPVARPVPS